MTLQEKRNYLAKYRSLKRRIIRDGERLRELRSLAEKITPRINDITYTSSGCDNDIIQSTIEKISEREQIETENIVRSIAMSEHIENAIAMIDNDMQRELLEFRYIDVNTVETTAEFFELSTRYTYSELAKALKKLIL